jgi:DNA-3-methyladenine glycosylase II
LNRSAGLTLWTEGADPLCISMAEITLTLMAHESRTRRKLPFDAVEAVAHLKKNDPKLGALIERVGEFKMLLDSSPSPFETLLEAILYQQLHGKAAATIHRRVREFFGGDPTPKQLLGVPDDVLRTAGVSGNKVRALKDLAAKTLDGTVPSHAAIMKMPDADIVERLTEVRGIGSWTVEMLLIFRLGRPDVLPVTDYGVRKGYALTFLKLPKTRPVEAADLPKPDVLFRRGRKWAPFRSVASWYLWRACDLAKDKGTGNTE